MKFEILEKKPKKEREAPPDMRIDKEMYPWLDHLDDEERVNKHDPKKEFKPIEEFGSDGLEDEVLEKIDAERAEKKEKKEEINDDEWIKPGINVLVKGNREVFEVVDVIPEDSQAILKNAITGEEERADLSRIKPGPESFRAADSEKEDSEKKGFLNKILRKMR